MTEFLRHEKSSKQELLLEIDSDEAGLSDSDRNIDTDTDRGRDKDSAAESGTQVHI
jgi:hypothetical protein